MAMSAGSEDGEPMVEMNTTPLIDVMLVLLIMFIITIPIQTHAVKIDLPQNAPPTDSVIDPVKNKVAIDPSGVITWNGSAIDLLTLRQYLQQSLRLPVEPELQFPPNAANRYVVVDEVLAELQRSAERSVGKQGDRTCR